MGKIRNLETERLHIRPLTMDDKEAWLEFLQGEGSLDFLPGIEPTLEQSEWWISRQLWRYKSYNCGLMALINKQTGEFIGQCGLLVQHIDGCEELEIAYHIIPRFRGKGYATEAAQAFKKYAFENRLADSLISLIHVDNEKSKKVAERNGMQCEKITRNCELFPGIPHCVYRITK